jgi:membrane protease YdiL (CAAX protease family)
MSDEREVLPPEAEQPRPQLPPEREPFWSYSDLALFIGLSLPCILLSWGAMRGILALFRLKDASGAIEAVGGQLLFYVLLFFGLRMIFLAEYGKPFWESLGWKPTRLPVLTVALLGVCTAVGVALTSVVLRVPETPNQMTDMMRDPRSLILMAVFGITVAPLAEELVFRGFLQPLLVRSLTAIPGILLAAFSFGMLHFHEYGNSWRHAVVISLAGVAFGAMRHLTGSTRAAALMHAAYNAFLFFALFSQRKDLPHF